jgi:hypothetical protein
MERDAANEIFKLHELAWDKTNSLLSYSLSEKSEEKML